MMLSVMVFGILFSIFEFKDNFMKFFKGIQGNFNVSIWMFKIISRNAKKNEVDSRCNKIIRQDLERLQQIYD
jgi:hypothetical protein